MGYIYIFTNKINEKSYIGQTTRPIEKRLEEHQKGKKGCRAIYSAIKKYGWENFKIDWYECPDEDLNFDEDLLVREMGTLSPDGYNLKEGGGNNGKMSEETKQKQSEAKQGDKCYMFGKHHNEETIQKQSESMMGEKNHKSKRVYQYDLDGTFIGSFGSVEEAARHLKIPNGDGGNIGRCARGIPRYKTAYKFKWSYESSM